MSGPVLGNTGDQVGGKASIVRSLFKRSFNMQYIHGWAAHGFDLVRAERSHEP